MSFGAARGGQGYNRIIPISQKASAFFRPSAQIAIEPLVRLTALNHCRRVGKSEVVLGTIGSVEIGGWVK